MQFSFIILVWHCLHALEEKHKTQHMDLNKGHKFIETERLLHYNLISYKRVSQFN